MYSLRISPNLDFRTKVLCWLPKSFSTNTDSWRTWHVNRLLEYPDENSSWSLRLHGSAKTFVHLTFPFTWELPESIRKAAFRIPTAEIVVHWSSDSNIKTTFLFHGFIFLYGAQRKRGGLPFTRYRNKSEFVRFRRWTNIWADSCWKFEWIGGSRVNAKPIRTNFHPD